VTEGAAAAMPAGRRIARLAGIAPLVPALLVLAVFFIVPMLELARMSVFEHSRTSVFVSRLTTANYAQFFSDPF
jgi:ABC-type sugar transport system permease subunit